MNFIFFKYIKYQLLYTNYLNSERQMTKLSKNIPNLKIYLNLFLYLVFRYTSLSHLLCLLIAHKYKYFTKSILTGRLIKIMPTRSTDNVSN